MPDFQQILDEATVKDSNRVPGCILTAVDSKGEYLYKASAGRQSVLEDAPPIDPNGVMWIASCTKMLTAICVLQLKEKGLVDLDASVYALLPELKDRQLYEHDKSSEKGYNLIPNDVPITLRHLLTHTSGIGYPFMSPEIQIYRQHDGANRPVADYTGTIAQTFDAPLLFAPGAGWVYGGGVDYAGTIVERVSGINLDQYMDDHIFRPLSMKDTTFQLAKRPDLEQRLIPTTARNGEGKLVAYPRDSWSRNANVAYGGSGLWSTAPDYIKVLADLVKPEPVLLKATTLDEFFFRPQIPHQSPAINYLEKAHSAVAANAVAGSRINYSLGGMLIMSYAEESGMPPNTLTWGGLPNLKFFLNREHGVAGLYASQVVPPGDGLSTQLSAQFCKEVMRLAKEKGQPTQ